MILSGDVHYAHIMQSPCKGLNAGYAIPEFISSGMTHHDGEFMIFGEEILHMLTHPIYTTERPFVNFNFGQLSVNPKTGDVKVNLKDVNGDKVWTSKYNTNTDL